MVAHDQLVLELCTLQMTSGGELKEIFGVRMIVLVTVLQRN